MADNVRRIVDNDGIAPVNQFAVAANIANSTAAPAYAKIVPVPNYTGNLRVETVTTKKQHYLTDYGLPGDGAFHSIASLFPAVTLAEVQALNPTATLENSADWYILQKLTNEVEKHSEIILDGSFLTDIPIVIHREHLIYSGIYDTKVTRNTGGLWSVLYAQGNIEAAFILAGVPGQYGQYNLAFRDFYVFAKGSVKPKYGIKVAAGMSGSYEVNGLFLENSSFAHFAHSGLALESGVTWLRIDNCGFSYNSQNGIYGAHGVTGQKNDIKICNCSFGGNGYDESLSGHALADKTMGHAINISGTAISITECEFAFNGNTGVYLNDGPCSGIHIDKNYFEKNFLADIYVTPGAASYRHNFFIGPSTYYEERSTPVGPDYLGRVYVESMGRAVRCIPDFNVDLNTAEIKDTDIALPIATYIHTGNKEIIVSAVDIVTGTFTAVGHGLSNGALIAPVPNWANEEIYPIDKYPGGLSQPANGYYVETVDADRFKLYMDIALTTAVALSANPNLDLSLWHFESVPVVQRIQITELAERSKCRLVIQSKNLLRASPVYVYTGFIGISQTYMRSPASIDVQTAATYSFPVLNLNGDIFNRADILIDNTGFNTLMVNAMRIRSNTASTNNVTYSPCTLVDTSYAHYNKAFTHVTITSMAFANGSKIEVYRA